MPAWAQAEPIRLLYHSYAGCPDEAQFLSDVTARTDRARRASGDEPARTFDVSLSAIGAQSRGALRIATQSGSVTRREVVGDTCDDVVSALALITALAVDPTAKMGAIPRTPPEEESAPEPSPQSAAPDPLPAPAAASQLDPPAAPLDTATPSQSGTRPHLSLGVEGQALAGFVPAMGAGGGAFIEYAGEYAGPLVSSFRGSIFATAANASFTPPVSAHLLWLFARLEACPLRLPVEDALALRLCLAMDAGVLRSDGAGLASVSTVSQPWLAPGALGRLAWTVPGGGAWIEGSVGVSVPLERYSFYYQRGGTAENVELSRVSVLGATLALGAGYRFP